MSLPNHINPDHYLERSARRVVTREHGKAAWERAYEELALQLRAVGANGTLYVVCGLQGAGKSTWVVHNAPGLGAHSVFFDAALPSRKHRLRALALASESGTPAIAVWINVPIELALQRNSARAEAERVPEETIHHVLSLLEPPALDEGFVEVIEIASSVGR